MNKKFEPRLVASIVGILVLFLGLLYTTYYLTKVMDANTTSIDLFIVIGLIIIITALHLFITNGAIIRLKMYTFRLQEKIDQLEKKHL